MTPSHQHITSLVKFHLSPHAITLRWHIFKYDKMYLVDINSLLFIPPRALRHCLSAWLALMKWSQMLLGRSLVIDWRKKIIKPWPTSEHTFWPRNLTHFFVFRNFNFYAFYRHFSIFSLYNTSKFLVSSYRLQFFPLECDIWVERTLYHLKSKTFIFENSIFYG